MISISMSITKKNLILNFHGYDARMFKDPGSS